MNTTKNNVSRRKLFSIVARPTDNIMPLKFASGKNLTIGEHAMYKALSVMDRQRDINNGYVDLIQAIKNADSDTSKQSRQTAKETITNTMKATAKTESKKDFATLMRNYETQASNPTTPDYATALQSLATSIAYAVLKKCIIVSTNKTLETLKRDIATATANQKAVDYLETVATETKHNRNGDYITTIADIDYYNELIRLTGETIGDGYDLVNDCIVAILSEQNKARERENTLQSGWLEKTYTQRALKRKVWIKTAESVNGWETVTTSPIQEIYKAVRRSIESSRHMQVSTNGYTYLEELATDTESDADAVIYRRFGKYADIGGAVVDFNGKETAYTANSEQIADYDTLIAKLNLTDRQMTIISYRMRGYGYKAIATALGIKKQSVQSQIRCIQKKCIALGITPEK